VAASSAMRRLLHIRQQEEEQGRAALESAVAELRRFEHALSRSLERARQGRQSAKSGDLVDRLAGLEETRMAKRSGAFLLQRIETARKQIEALRQIFLAKRVARLQAETLIRETEAREAMEAARREQRDLDDMHRAGRIGLNARKKAHGAPATLRQSDSVDSDR
jgi:flagellar export protein FliJ